MTAGRWATAAQALGYGAPLVEVAAALGVTPAEVGVGLRRWLDEQARQRLITPVQREETLALLTVGPVGGAR